MHLSHSSTSWRPGDTYPSSVLFSFAALLHISRNVQCSTPTTLCQAWLFHRLSSRLTTDVRFHPVPLCRATSSVMDRIVSVSLLRYLTGMLDLWVFVQMLILTLPKKVSSASRTGDASTTRDVMCNVDASGWQSHARAARLRSPSQASPSSGGDLCHTCVSPRASFSTPWRSLLPAIPRDARRRPRKTTAR